MHSGATNTKLVVRQALDQPVISEVWEPTYDRKKLGPRFKGDAKKLEELVLKMGQMELEECKKTFEEKGQVEFKLEGKEEPVVVDKDLMQINRVTKKETSITAETTLLTTVYEYTPNVIEPSFGIGRILYSLIEHAYWPRPEDKQRGVLPQETIVNSRSSPSRLSLLPRNVFSSLSPIMQVSLQSFVSSVSPSQFLADFST